MFLERVDPFAEIETPVDPFAEVDVDPTAVTQQTALDPETVNSRARLAAFANTDTGGTDYLSRLENTTALYSDLIQRYGEDQIRREVAHRERSRTVQALVDMTVPQMDPTGELRAGALHLAERSLREDIERRKESAVEEAAVRRVQELAAGGSTEEAKLMLNLMEHGSPADMIYDRTVKRMIIQREVENAGIARENQSWFRHLTDFAASIIPFDYGLSHSELVDAPGVVKRWYDAIFAGQRFQSEKAALWNLPADEFAVYVRDKLIPAIKENTTLSGYHNRSEELGLWTELYDKSSATEINFFGGLDLAGAIPVAKIASIPSFLGRNGARTAVADSIARAALKMADEGTEVAAKATGITVAEVTDNLAVSAVRTGEAATSIGVPLEAGARLERGRALIDLHAGQLQAPGRLKPEELEVALDAVETRIRNRYTDRVVDVNRSAAIELSDGSRTHRVEFTLGKKGGGGFADKKHAENLARSMNEAAEVVQDESGQWFVRTSRDITETGFYTIELRPQTTGWLGRKLLNARLVGDIDLADAAQVSNNTKARTTSRLIFDLAKPYRKLRGKERIFVDELLKRGEVEGKWFSRDEVEIFAREAFDMEPNDRIYASIQAAQDINDVEFALRNDHIYKTLVTRGGRDVQFELGTFKYDGTAFVSETLPDKIPTRVYDVSTGRHVIKVNDEIDTLKAQGYMLVRTAQPVQMPDGTYINRFVGKPDAFRVDNLSREQLAYRPGGHRMYAGTHFVRQTKYGTQPDTGKRFLTNPNTYTTGTKAEMTFWAGKMEQARQLYVRALGGRQSIFNGRTKADKIRAAQTAQSLAEQIDEVFEGRPGFPTGDDFIKRMEAGEYERNSKFVVTEDRVMPEEYNVIPEDVMNFADMEEGGFNGWLRTTGRMYTGMKGEHLDDWNGQRAITLDAYSTINRSLTNISQVSSLSDYKLQAVERWMKTYATYLDYDPNASPFRAFLDSSFKPGLGNEKIRQAGEAQREKILGMLGWKTEGDRQSMQYQRRFVDWVLGDDPTTKSYKFKKEALEWWKVSDPIQALRGWAFDLKLGLFNVAQFPLQISTMFAATSLDPVNGMKGMQSLPFLRMYIFRRKHFRDGDLSGFTRERMHLAAGFDSPEEFQLFLKTAEQSGFFDMNQHLLQGVGGPNSVLSATQGGINELRNHGRFFFNEAEVWNRGVAFRIAWEETRRKFPNLKHTDDKFKTYLAGRAEDYSLGMSNASAAEWQQGFAAIPTQFWAYNVRMMEAIMGNRFTPAQRMRLLAGQIALYGAAGFPLTAAVQQYIEAQSGETPDIGTVESLYTRGLMDNVIYAMTGADIQYGARTGTGNFLPDLFKELFGLSQYGPTSPAEFIGGATFGITGGVVGNMVDVGRYAMMEAGTEAKPMTEESLKRLARQVSTLSNIHKAMLMQQYGYYVSNRGNILASNVTEGESNLPVIGLKPSAFAALLSLQPGEMADLSAKSAHKKKKDKVVAEAARVITTFRTRYVQEPDNREEIAADVNAYVRLLPPDIRRDALRRAQRNTDPSLYDRLVEQFQRDQAEEELREQLSEEN